MALFFDVPWFDARLAERALTRADVATLLGLDEAAVAEMWKDQRELTAAHVSTLAAVLNVPPAEIAKRAGVSTPVPKPASDLAAVVERLDRIERALAELKAAIAKDQA